MDMKIHGMRLMASDYNLFLEELIGGGGLWISTLDLARIGQLMINRGLWDGKVVIPQSLGQNEYQTVRVSVKLRLYVVA